MKKNKYRKQIGDSFYDDTFSYLNYETCDSEALFEEEEKMNNLLEDYHIEDLDFSEFNDKSPDDFTLI